MSSSPSFRRAAALASTAASLAAVAASTASVPVSAAPLAADTSAQGLVDALNNVFGRHEGMRASHAKGFCADGVWVPSSQATLLSPAQPLAGSPAPVMARLSIGGGNPHASDKSRSVRGLAVRIGDGAQAWDLLMISEPVFFAATPESFVSFLQARMPDPVTKKPDPKKIEAHNLRFPEGRLQPTLLAAHPAPASYATVAYHSNHAFRFVPAKGSPVYARLIAVPAAGVHYLTEAQEKEGPDEFLEQEFTERLSHGDVQFDVKAQLAGPHDDVRNPATQWEGSGEPVLLGHVHLRKVSGQSCSSEVFVPTRLPAGIEPSEDPVLAARAAAYAVSLARRNR